MKLVTEKKKKKNRMKLVTEKKKKNEYSSGRIEVERLSRERGHKMFYSAK